MVTNEYITRTKDLEPFDLIKLMSPKIFKDVKKLYNPNDFSHVLTLVGIIDNYWPDLMPYVRYKDEYMDRINF